MGKFLKTIAFILLHLVAIAAITYEFLPIAQWYIHHRPILGVDFYNSVSFATFFKDNLHIFQQSYLDTSYAGTHIVSYPIINWFRVFALVAKFLPLFTAIKFTSLTAFFLLLVFVYFGTIRLSGNPFVAGVLALLVLTSGSMYGSLTWGGSLPYFANQLFFPLILFTLASFLETGNKRWYWATILFLGMAVAGHIGNASAFGIPAAVLLILFGKRSKPIGIKKRIKEVAVFIILLDVLVYKYLGAFWNIIVDLLFHLIGVTILRIPGPTGFTSATAKSSAGASDTQAQITTFYHNIVLKLFTDTNKLLFVGLGIACLLFLVGFLALRRKRDAVSVIPWVLLCFYAAAHVYINANGISFLSQGWYRAFWHFPITVAFLTASLLGVAQAGFTSRGRVFTAVFFIPVATIWLGIGAFSFISQDRDKALAFIEKESSTSSSYPEALNLFRTDEEFSKLKNSLLPPWMAAKDKRYRFFSDDAQVIIWWNALFDIPQARGYLDAPGNTGQHHLLDQAIGGDGLVNHYKYPQDIARNMALYYIDWYAIKYGEGGHVSQSPNNPPSSYLEDVIAEKSDVQTKGVLFLHETKSGKPEINEDAPQFLKYYRFSDSVTSPIVSISNAPTIACFCDFPAYESLLKILSMHNLNSQKLVSLYIPESIDQFSEETFKQFDIVLLSNYAYQNRSKTFNLLQNYLKRGGKIIFDTGGEVKESKSQLLPDWFPFSQSQRGGLGKEWQLEVNPQSEITKDLDAGSFAPPTFEQNEWNFSYPQGSVKADTDVLLKQNGTPLLMRLKVGDGTLIWSGMNLIYHVQYNTNFPESQLFVNILQSLTELSTHSYSEAAVNYPNSNAIDLQSKTTGRGILIKQQMYDHWKAIVNGKNLPMFKAGASYPGFMYIPLTGSEQISAHINYIGNYQSYFYELLTWVTTIFLLDLILFNGILLTKHLQRVFNLTFKHTSSWWEKEEE